MPPFPSQEESLELPLSSCYLWRLKDSSLCREGRKTMGRFISVIFSLLVVFLSLSGTGADQDCLPGWSLYEGHCYKVFNQKMNWTDAEKFCTEQPNGKHLASIEWLGKANFVAELVSESLKDYKYHFYVWIGLSDQSERQQCSSHWSDGSSVCYDNGVYSTKCFGLEEKTGYRTWVARPCRQKYPFICMSWVPPEHPAV